MNAQRNLLLTYEKALQLMKDAVEYDREHTVPTPTLQRYVGHFEYGRNRKMVT